uniref:BTB domain-containing protein n=1 Tax=Meloidogyne incognita TaxID=6306 RepID=A0A914L278_MELIC
MFSFLRLIFSFRPLTFIFTLILRVFKFLLSPIVGKSKSTGSTRTGSTSSISTTNSSYKSRQPRNSIVEQESIYDEYNIVCEQFLSVNVGTLHQQQQNSYNNYSSGTNFSATRAWIDGKEWEFSVITKNNQHILRLTLLELDWHCVSVDAEVCFWQWHRGKQIQILQRGAKCFQQPESYVQFQPNTGNNYGSNCPSDGHFYVLIRLLERRQRLENFGNIPFDESECINLTVGTDSFTVSKHYLMSLSPVFQKMFNNTEQDEQEGEHKEGKQQQKEVLVEEASPEAMKQFLEAISPKQIHPNPNNVYQLLKLANRFQVDFLRKKCEAHLIHCVEMPLMERLIYADAYHLDKLKNYILKSLSGAGLREFYDENQSAMHLLGMELLIQLTQRICSSVKRMERISLCQNCQKNVVRE